MPQGRNMWWPLVDWESSVRDDLLLLQNCQQKGHECGEQLHLLDAKTELLPMAFQSSLTRQDPQIVLCMKYCYKAAKALLRAVPRPGLTTFTSFVMAGRLSSRNPVGEETDFTDWLDFFLSCGGGGEEHRLQS